MSFPTADMQAAFGDFLAVDAIRRYLEKQRPDLLPHRHHTEGEPLIGLRLPGGQQVLCARTRGGILAGWACITPTGTDDDIRATMGSSTADLAKLMTRHCDTLTTQDEGRSMTYQAQIVRVLIGPQRRVEIDARRRTLRPPRRRPDNRLPHSPAHGITPARQLLRDVDIEDATDRTSR